MLDMFVFETTQLLEQLEQIIISSEKYDYYEQDTINEIFRIMHTIKGSSAMMSFNNISTLAHTVEDLFYYIREENPSNIESSVLSDMILDSVDFIKSEINEIKNGVLTNNDASSLNEKIKSYLEKLKNSEAKTNKNSFKAVIYFEDGCGMENLRALALVNDLKSIAGEIQHIPSDICENDDTADTIKREGFQILFKTDRTFDEMYDFFSKTIFLKNFELALLNNDAAFESKVESEMSSVAETTEKNAQKEPETESKSLNKDFLINSNMDSGMDASKGIDKELGKDTTLSASYQSMISVNISKLDKLMDLVGELVISEAMVTQNPDLAGLELENFQKAASQHRKIINELQDVAMSIRMVPLSVTFQKMNRVVRDMSRKLNKDVALRIIGEDTEVDKNIIEHISDPLMHLIRNAIDHGIESAEERKAKGKPEKGTVTLEAKNAGGDVLILVKDDGKGLDRNKILQRAKEHGLVNRPESELLDQEIYSYIFLPGFSTKENITEFSGRGVGMDVVSKNIGAVGGTVTVDSTPGEGTVITLKIPLTLAIMDGMTVRVGKSKYTVPIINIKESFKAKEEDVITDPEGNEMIMIRGDCYPIIRLHELYKVKTEITNISDGIIMVVENEGKNLCILVDELIGEQQVVVKALPDYIKKFNRVRGLAGCTLLGDGSISLILDIAGLFKLIQEGR